MVFCRITNTIYGPNGPADHFTDHDVMTINGIPGVNLQDVHDGHALFDGQEQLFADCGRTKVGVTIMINGHPTFRNHVHIHRTENRAPVSLCRGEVAQRVIVKSVQKFIKQVSAPGAPEQVGRWQFGPGRIELHHLWMTCIYHASAGSYQPILWVDVPPLSVETQGMWHPFLGPADPTEQNVLPVEWNMVPGVPLAIQAPPPPQLAVIHAPIPTTENPVPNIFDEFVEALPTTQTPLQNPEWYTFTANIPVTQEFVPNTYYEMPEAFSPMPPLPPNLSIPELVRMFQDYQIVLNMLFAMAPGTRAPPPSPVDGPLAHSLNLAQVDEGLYELGANADQALKAWLADPNYFREQDRAEWTALDETIQVDFNSYNIMYN